MLDACNADSQSYSRVMVVADVDILTTVVAEKTTVVIMRGRQHNGLLSLPSFHFPYL